MIPPCTCACSSGCLVSVPPCTCACSSECLIPPCLTDLFPESQCCKLFRMPATPLARRSCTSMHLCILLRMPDTPPARRICTQESKYKAWGACASVYLRCFCHCLKLPCSADLYQNRTTMLPCTCACLILPPLDGSVPPRTCACSPNA